MRAKLRMHVTYMQENATNKTVSESQGIINDSIV